MKMNISAKGNGVSPGIAIGPAYIINAKGLQVPEFDIPANQIEKEIKRLHAAIAKTQKQLSQLKQKAASLPAGAEDMAAVARSL